MGITYRIVYHKQVITHDIPLLSKEWRGKIKSAIENKLVSHPEIFGIPLRNTLKNYRKLRVGNYRIIFRIESKTVLIFVISHRSNVYLLSNKRTT
ncbi:MAG: type II toxin-antitoxin system RelE/ParE family toxin [bacterium]|nr:type II toxin-antitoxin system RelE/ParE family toxin [bacterium]